MNKLIKLLFLLVFSICFSQTNRFIYELDVKKYTKNVKINMVLDVTKDEVKFYDYGFIEADSIGKRNNVNQFYNTQVDQLIIRKTNSFENTEFHDNMFDYFSINSKDEMVWKIEKETKKSGEYTLQKATTNFGGRFWTAWFCAAIPFQEGPYKFRGLPGLIFELNDQNKDFTYILVKIKKLNEDFDTKKFLETHYETQPIRVTRKQYHDVKINYYNDPVSEGRKILKNGGNITFQGEKITTVEQLDQKRKSIQESIKNYYSPLELDKAIPYPN